LAKLLQIAVSIAPLLSILISLAEIIQTIVSNLENTNQRRSSKLEQIFENQLHANTHSIPPRPLKWLL